MDELPFGTRGGLAVAELLPARRRIHRSRSSSPAAPREPHRSRSRVDGERVQVAAVGGAPDEAGGRGARQAAGPRSTFRIPVKAGPRLVGVTFIERNEVRDEATLRPRMRGRGTEPALRIVTISGPYDAKAPGDTPSRRRIFVCRPTDEPTTRARAQILSRSRAAPTGGRSTDADIQDLLPFLRARPRGRRVRARHPARARAAAGQPAVSLSHRARPAPRCSPGAAYPDQRPRARVAALVLPVEQHPGRRAAGRRRAGPAEEPGVLERRCGGCSRDPRSASLVTNFAAQWLYLRDIEAKQPDESLVPRFRRNAARGHAHARRSCSSTASCARTAACSIC